MVEKGIKGEVLNPYTKVIESVNAEEPLNQDPDGAPVVLETEAAEEDNAAGNDAYGNKSLYNSIYEPN